LVWVTIPSRPPYSLTIVAKRTGAFLNCSKTLKQCGKNERGERLNERGPARAADPPAILSD
jgi:hypothetical protein